MNWWIRASVFLMLRTGYKLLLWSLFLKAEFRALHCSLAQAHVELVGFWSCIFTKFAKKQSNDFFQWNFEVFCDILLSLLLLWKQIKFSKWFNSVIFFDSTNKFTGPIVFVDIWFQFYDGGKWHYWFQKNRLHHFQLFCKVKRKDTDLSWSAIKIVIKLAKKCQLRPFIGLKYFISKVINLM